MKSILLSILFVFAMFPARSYAQTDTGAVVQVQVIDSVKIRDSIRATVMLDSFSKQPPVKASWKQDTLSPLISQIVSHNPYFPIGGSRVVPIADGRVVEGKELLFYVLVALLLVFAFLKTAFGKYFTDLFRLFFRTTLKQRQIREQLMQTPLPSLLLNIFYVISAGLYIDFMLLHYELIDESEFWLFLLYCCIGLAVIYFVKFLGLKILGWIFNMQDAADSYVFIVFIINKVIGVFLVPFLVGLAFMQGTSYQIALVLSWTGVGALVCYRFILTYGAVRNQVKFNPFHFFLYLCAFEIAPLLLIYKLLLMFFQ